MAVEGRGIKRFIRNFLLFALVWTPVTVLLWTLAMVSDAPFYLSFLISLAIAEPTMLTCYCGVHFLSLAEQHWYRSRNMTVPNRSSFVKILRSFIFILPGLFIGFEFASTVARSLGLSWQRPEFAEYRKGLIIGFFNIAVFLVLHLRKDLEERTRKSELELKESETRTLKAQLAALTAQMNPHFLFNSLNSIAASIHSNPQSAEDMIVELSDLYRRILQASRHDRHTLSEELDICRTFLKTEIARFGERISFSISVDSGLDPSRIQIPVLILQPLVENSLKHGIFPRQEGGKIAIRVHAIRQTLFITVEDDGVGFDHPIQKSSGSGTALDNCKLRLELAYKDCSAIRLEDNKPNGTRAIVELPLDGTYL